MYHSHILALMLLATVVVTCVGWDLNLIHINDIHVRMEETNKYSAACRQEDKRRGKCFGGIARLQTALKQLRTSGSNALCVNAGDFYQGTVWYSHFKWKVVSKFNNLLNFDAMTLGNHEFDDGVKGLVPFLKNQTVPFVVSNIDIQHTPELSGLYQPSVVIRVGGRRIGLIGYLTPETLEVSNPGKLIINDEIEAVRREAEKLTNEGVDIIIGLGHSGYDKDIEIAKSIPEIDVVVGGHTHSFLYDEKLTNPSNNIIEGPYPTIVNNTAGGVAAVVQAYAYTKYLGHMKLTFDDHGKLKKWKGEPILLDNRFDEDEVVSQELKLWKAELDKIGKVLVGSSDVILFNTREGESNIGNLVTDAMVWAYRHNPDTISIAMINSGGIRASFDKGNITMEDLLISFPFRNTFDLVFLQGAVLRAALEHSVASMKPDGRNEAGRFLQVSGIKILFDLTRPVGKRLLRADISCKTCSEELQPLMDEEVYKVVMTEYLANGGDGYSNIAEKKERHLQGPLDTDILREYIKGHSPLSKNVEKRISVKTENLISESAANPLISYHILLELFLLLRLHL